MPDVDPRERILNATQEILEEDSDAEKITVRRIAERAEVGIGLINYHFGSKERLLNEAVMGKVQALAERWLGHLSSAGREAEPDPLQRLKRMLRESSDMMIRLPALTRIPIQYDLLHGTFTAPQMMLPLLREIYQSRGQNPSDLDVRLAALQIIIFMQVTFLRSDTFRLYSGVDLFDKQQRDALIDRLVDQLVTS